MRNLICSAIGVLLFINSPFAKANSSCSFQPRQVSAEDGKSYYTVNSRAPTLYMISRDVYGTPKYWSQIAKVNSLKPPYPIEPNQKLLLPMPPKITESAAHAVLTSAWSAGGARGLTQLKQVCKPQSDRAVATEVKEQVAADQVAEAPAAAAPSEPVQEKVAEPAIAPAPMEPEHHAESASHESHWIFQVAAVASMFKLKVEEPSHHVTHKLDSKLNYGLELEVGYKTSGKMSYFAGAGLEHIEVKDSASGKTKVNDPNLLGFFVRAQRQLSKPIMVYGSFHYLQHIFAESGDHHDVVIDGVFLPEFRLGGMFETFHLGHWHSHLIADVIYALPAKEGHHDVESNYGFHVGPRFIRHMSEHSAVLVTLLYRQLYAKTSHTKDEEQAAILTVGYEF